MPCQRGTMGMMLRTCRASFATHLKDRVALTRLGGRKVTASNDDSAKRSRSSGSTSDPSSSRRDQNMTPPPGAAGAATSDGSPALPLVKANPALPSGVHVVEPPNVMHRSVDGSDALPPEADGTNSQTLAPGDPRRQSDEGQPYLDDANPYGRPLINQQNRPIGGIGTVVDPKDQERPLDRTEAPASSTERDQS